MKPTDKTAPFFLSVDRIEDGSVICYDEEQRRLVLPMALLPGTLKEGDILFISEDCDITIDVEKTQSIRNRNAQRLRRLAER